MIGPEDIEAFSQHHQEDLKAADELARRKEKGLPSDRWADGHSGMVKVARGIRAYQRLVELFADAWLERDQYDTERGRNATEPWRDPMRHDSRGEG